MELNKMFIVDEHTDSRRATCEYLQQNPKVKIIGEVASVLELIAKLETLMPDTILMDFATLERSGIESAPIIKQRWPSVRLVIVTSPNDTKYISNEFLSKADAIVLKSSIQAQKS